MNDLKYTSTHEWSKEDNGLVVVGITQHAQELLGDMVFIELPAIGSQIEAGAELGVVESVKAASDFYAPISGEVIDVNEDARQDPAIINRDPYHKGWLVKIKPSHPDEWAHLLSESEYEEQLAEDH